MIELFRQGGFPMWFLLAFGSAALVAGARFAWSPSSRSPKPVLALGGATGFATLTGICAALSQVGHHAPAYLRKHPELTLPEVLLQGFAESMSPGILGFTLLSATALLLALGWQRVGAQV
jgi:hypothetical protein